MRKLVLKSGVAVATLIGLGLALSAQAHFHTKPVVQPMSSTFTTESHQTAQRTVEVVATGTTDTYHGNGHVTESDLPDVGTTAVIACPQDGQDDAAWKQVPQDVRQNARPGECYARLLMAPKFENFTDHVMVADAHTESHTVPEVAQMVDKDVMVAPEHVVHKTVAAVSHMEMQTVVVTPATYREETIPAQYETRVEHVMVAPEHQEWVASAGIPTGAALVTPVDHQPVRYRADGSLTWPGKNPVVIPASDETADYLQQGSAQTVYCLKIIPAQYEDRRTQVQVSPASVRRIDVPAVVRQERRVVVDVPEHVEDVVIPAVYQKQKVREIVTPGHTEVVNVPAVFQDVAKSRMVNDPQPVWRQVLCSRNASPAKIAEIQRALAQRGYNPGPDDGRLGSQTVSAMQKFQADKGLAQGQISVEAVEALGLSAS